MLSDVLIELIKSDNDGYVKSPRTFLNEGTVYYHRECLLLYDVAFPMKRF